MQYTIILFYEKTVAGAPANYLTFLLCCNIYLQYMSIYFTLTESRNLLYRWFSDCL